MAPASDGIFRLLSRDEPAPHVGTPCLRKQTSSDAERSANVALSVNGVAVLAPVLAHALAQLQGGDDHAPPPS